MTRDAEASTGEFLELVLSGINRESDVGVTSGVLRQLSMAIDQFAAATPPRGVPPTTSTSMRGVRQASRGWQ